MIYLSNSIVRQVLLCVYPTDGELRQRDMSKWSQVPELTSNRPLNLFLSAKLHIFSFREGQADLDSKCHLLAS